MAHQTRHVASDPPHAEPALTAVPAHVRKYAPRAPRHRGPIAHRLETDLPRLAMSWGVDGSGARWRVADCGACSPRCLLWCPELRIDARLEPEVEFPAGTWWVVRCANAIVAT